ncbi:MAG: M55 family metallopeptidase, partial [Candidatus Edwardsbacteria bacterium]|nr:M55 family metallopeptidase [Candidatus Edwardsbacteria bacterium]
VNQYIIAEIGSALFNLQGIPFLANIGDQGSMAEAAELCQGVTPISVKDKDRKWAPPIEETYPMIKGQVKECLNSRERAPSLKMEGPFTFSLSLRDGYRFDPPATLSWKGHFEKDRAFWEAPSAAIGLELLWHVTEHISAMNPEAALYGTA